MAASSQEGRGLARGVVGSAWVIAFGSSIVAPAGSVVTALVLVVSFAGFAFRTEFREEFRLWRHLLVPGAAALLFLFPLWGILRPPAYTLMGALPFMALGWLCVGAIAAFKTLGRVFMPADR
jgi:hypothetical protein